METYRKKEKLDLPFSCQYQNKGVHTVQQNNNTSGKHWGRAEPQAERNKQLPSSIRAQPLWAINLPSCLPVFG